MLAQLGIEDCFDAICDIRTIGFAAKPTLSGYHAVVSRIGVAPQHCAMFEDAERNLVPAHALGMTTVWLQDYRAERLPLPSHVHHDTDDLVGFLQSIKVRTSS